MDKWNMKKLVIISTLTVLLIISVGFSGYKISTKSAENIVRKLVLKDTNTSTISEFDHEETVDGVKYFVIHVYDIVIDHTATWGWYYVNQNNGKVFNGTFGNLTPMN